MLHNYSKSKISIGIVGGTGYSGLELVRILGKHPNVQNLTIFGTKTQQPSSAKNFQYHHIDELFNLTSNFDVIFLATPAEVSHELTPKLLEAKIHVIDLSGAFRLNTQSIKEDYKHWYKMDHHHTELVQKAHYGLVPWTEQNINPEKPCLIANPGCYATAILLALLPLLKNKVIQEDYLVIDAKSGTTGAGKKPDESLLFSEVDGECLPYKIGAHQHLPEITLSVKNTTNVGINPHFSTHLLPTRRGIIAGIYTKLKEGKKLHDVEQAFQEFYAHYPFVKHSSGLQKDYIQLKKVVGTPSTHISYVVDNDKLYLFSALDNLMKGAATQAIENFNQLYNLPLETGLEHLECIL